LRASAVTVDVVASAVDAGSSDDQTDEPHGGTGMDTAIGDIRRRS